ncbi:Npun_R2479 family HD domain-containing metalloprotein [Floridanema evergladense]|uniref:Npun_R2479 family HD domain-containing metalloprotein n=1 Tax=Floridaenema evergladense BLCC-F167 TaxID=3153639 RepID=A0ABV4WP25_9CYAN
MFNATQILIDTFVEKLREGYHRTYGGLKTDYEDIIGWAGNMALENIANSDALYHNVEHTVLVTLVGQEILRGKHIREGGVSCEDWLHYIISLLCHDIGYVKGVCRQDREDEGLYATGKEGGMVKLPPGASDASLTPYHVDRGKLFITERFGGHKLIDAEIIKRSIELTRFPVPSAEDHQNTVNYAGLVRAADLIGQLSDPRYLKKITSLYYEFEETGVNKALNYRHPGDLRRNYSKFYWNGVFPFIKEALRYLQLTQQGKQIIANLYSNVFVVEHEKAEEDRRQLVEQLN